MSHLAGQCPKSVLAGTILACILPSGIQLLFAQAPDPAKIRSLAESKHEIVMLLIKKKDFEKAAAEANEIFRMPWPESEEPVLLKELLGVSDQFRHCKQPALAVRLLESNRSVFKSNKNKAAIWKDEGYLYEEMGMPDKAIECFREAQRLDMKSPELKSGN